jgi:hypothetical protein
MSSDETARLAELERSLTRMRRFTILSCLLLVGLSSAAFLKVQTAPTVLTVSELKVTDQKGVVRVHIGGELPGSNRGQGSEGTAGLLLFDATGAERGGYITTDSSGYIGLTLDSRRVSRTTASTQTAVFRADSIGSTVLRLWNAEHMFEITADRDGARYNVLQARQIIAQDPPVPNPRSSAVCTELRLLRAQYDSTLVRKACRERMTEGGCKLCLTDR